MRLERFGKTNSKQKASWCRQKKIIETMKPTGTFDMEIECKFFKLYITFYVQFIYISACMNPFTQYTEHSHGISYHLKSKENVYFDCFHLFKLPHLSNHFFYCCALRLGRNYLPLVSQKVETQLRLRLIFLNIFFSSKIQHSQFSFTRLQTITERWNVYISDWIFCILWVGNISEAQ